MVGKLFQNIPFYEPFVAEFDAGQLSLSDEPPDRLGMDAQSLAGLSNVGIGCQQAFCFHCWLSLSEFCCNIPHQPRLYNFWRLLSTVFFPFFISMSCTLCGFFIVGASFDGACLERSQRTQAALVTPTLGHTQHYRFDLVLVV